MKSSLAILPMLIGMLIVGYSCSERERNNPLDPNNPKTGGVLTGLNAFSQERQVYLQWNSIGLKDVNAINVYRKASDDSNFVLLGQVPSGTVDYTDKRVEYGKKYDYCITVQVGDYESPFSETASVTPGPTYTWVSDAGSGYVVCLTHDLRHHLFDFGILYFPYTIAVSPRERSAWVYARYEDIIYKLNQTGEPAVALQNLAAVTDMAVDTTLLDLWFSQSSNGTISKIQANGMRAFLVTTMQKPTALAMDSRGHYCWAIDAGSTRKLVRINNAGRIEASSEPLRAPKDLAISEIDNAVWVADSASVVKYDFSAQPAGIAAEGFYFAWLIAYDERRNVCWVIDKEPPGQPASLYKIDVNGQVLFRLSEFGDPQSIAVSEFDGSCLVADPGRAGLFKVSKDGSSIEAVGSFSAAYSVAVENH
jgi:hypothetical protein